MTWITEALALLGAAFTLVAALGVLRMPDLYTRMHAATKAGALGAGLILVAVGVAFRDPGVAVRAGAAVAFLAITAPVAAHVVARAAYGKEPLWNRTIVDELGKDQPGDI